MAIEPDFKPLYLHPHGAANQAVALHDGPVTILGVGTDVMQATGTLALRWLPTTGLRLNVELPSAHIATTGARMNVEIAGSVAEAVVTSTTLGTEDGVPFARVSGIVSKFEKGSGGDLAALGFQVVNFSDFLTPGPRPAPVFGFPPRVADLLYGVWRVRLTAVEDSNEIFKSLSETGGYAFTHLGQLERSDGSRFNAAEGATVLDALGRFLGFARGAPCSLPIRWGVDGAGEVVWEQWTSPVVDPWKVRSGWFDEHHGNLLSEIYPEFARTLADPDLGEPFSLALHWYQQSNTRAGGMEGAIILGLTALDLLGALVVVDRVGAMTASKYDKLPAARKLSMLLEPMKVSASIPSRYSNLEAFATENGSADAAVALAEIRHGYVHPNKRRRQVVLSAPNLATFEAWQLSLWYQELALLYLLNHRGEFSSRIVSKWRGEVEKVPWA
ncbi:MAG: hypothetical protein SH850_26285 [Planctomycetaceae bacterium]|nr:hypothetical protein [Planctomycetaceae bacterium]